METLPSSIESHFKEAGFSATEILIIKKLVEGDAMTLRDLAFKTGKSTGVLDQAMKKLLKKKIVLREMINGTPKYVLHSLDSVMKWLEGDMQNKKRTLEMRHQNFEAFISSINAGKKRPEMQFFEGLEGMKKAYTLLLEKGNDFVQYGPTIFTETEDPLREFRVQYFRERRKRNIFLRVITHNTPLGRRAISRDPFEYRKTILVDENSYPFCFEKIIVGNTVACFQYETQEACFIEYKELAERERQFFEKLWNLKLQHPDEGVEISTNPLPIAPSPPIIPTKTKILSEVREFFLSGRSVVAFGVCGILAAGITYFLYQHNYKLNLERIREIVKSIAITGTMQFNAENLNNLDSVDDIGSDLYQKTVSSLFKIKTVNNNIKYVYLIRPKSDNSFEFIADADAYGINPFEKNDVDRNGVVDPSDEVGFPTRKYDITHIDILEKKLYLEPITTQEPYEDQWGKVYTGYAPIFDDSGKVSALLAVDISVFDLFELNNKTFNLIYYFVSFFLVFLLLRLFAFNKTFP